MAFSNTYSVSDIISAVSAVLVVIGGLFAFVQWRKNVALKRASYINELTEKIRTDPDIKDIVYLFDYEDRWYSSHFHGSGELERKVDKTLSYFSYICYLKNQKLINKKDFKFFQYEIDRILINPDVQDYFYNLYHFSSKFKMPFTFFYLFKYGKRKKMFDASFFDNKSYIKDSTIFHHYLNF